MGSRATIISNTNLTDYSFNVYAFTRNEADGSDDALFMGTNDTEQEGNGGIKISHDGTQNGIMPTQITSSIGLLTL